MRYQLIVSPEMSRTIGSFGLSRQALVRLLTNVRSELEEHADRYRHQRDPNHHDLYFRFELHMRDQGRLRSFRFTLDDARAPERLFLVAADEV
ncbi:MAG TPA: hypothetical protein VK395_37910 [Gemmataceae bacterium]|nr:hypothetical protein [Gemmataceae bacterium]